MSRARNWKTDLGVGLIVSATILMCLPIWAAVHDPKIVIEDWDFFVPLIVLPIGIGIALHVIGKRAG